MTAWLRALSLLAHKVKRLIGNSVKGFSWFFRPTGLRRTDAALLSREIKLFEGIVPRGLGLLLMLFSVQNAMADTTWFITKWQTTTAGENIIIPVNSSLTYSYDIDCDNDSTFEQTVVKGNGTCTYASAGEHVINIRGAFPAIFIGEILLGKVW